MILRRETPSAVLFYRLTGPGNDMPRDVTRPHMPHRLLLRIELMESAVSSRQSKTQRCYKGNFDNNVRRELTLNVGNFVFIDRPQLVTIVPDAADEKANR